MDTGAWARVDADALPPEQRAMFMRRRSAIKLYLAGALDADIRREAGMVAVQRLLRAQGRGGRTPRGERPLG